MAEYGLGIITGLLIGGALTNEIRHDMDEASRKQQVMAVQTEITNYVKQNPSQGYYECTTASGKVLHIKAGDFQSGKITVSLADPVQPSTCKAVLNGSVAQPG